MALKLRQMESLFDEGYSLADLLPYIEYTDGIFVLADGSLGKIWHIDPWETEGRGQEFLSLLAGHLENLLTRIPTERLACQMILKKTDVFFTLRYFPHWRHHEQMASHQEDFRKYTSLIEGVFRSAGIEDRSVDGEAMTQWLYGILNPKRRQSIPKVILDEEDPIRDQIIFSSPQTTHQDLVCE